LSPFEAGLKTSLVIVSEWPSRTVPTGCHESVLYRRTTACSGAVALQAVAMSGDECAEATATSSKAWP